MNSSLVLFLPFLLVMGGILFFGSRRQRRAMQATIDLHESLAVGDRVHTTSGLEGTIAGITEDNVDLEIAPGVVTTWMKLAIRDKILPDDELDDASSEGVDEDIDEDIDKDTVEDIDKDIVEDIDKDIVEDIDKDIDKDTVEDIDKDTVEDTDGQVRTTKDV